MLRNIDRNVIIQYLMQNPLNFKIKILIYKVQNSKILQLFKWLMQKVQALKVQYQKCTKNICLPIRMS